MRSEHIHHNQRQPGGAPKAIARLLRAGPHDRHMLAESSGYSLAEVDRELRRLRNEDSPLIENYKRRANGRVPAEKVPLVVSTEDPPLRPITPPKLIVASALQSLTPLEHAWRNA